MENTSIPQHIAVIMDGNRRWAKKKGLPVLAGHKFVTDHILEPLVEHAAKRGVKFITFWAWSTENWERNKNEVTGIMRLFRYSLKHRWQRMHKKGIRINVIGDLSKFDADIRQELDRVVMTTRNNTVITVVFALNYGGRDEILRAIRKLRIQCHPGVPIGKLNRDDRIPSELLKDNGILSARPYVSFQNDSLLNEKNFSNYLDTAGIPDPDLIVRTGGEMRLSGFLLWQSEYSELMFPDWYMPEFTPLKLDEILIDFRNRQRRFGK